MHRKKKKKKREEERHHYDRTSRPRRSVPVVSAVVRRPAPLGLEDALADVAVRRGIGRVLVLGRDVPQERVLRGERDAALVAVRRRRVAASRHQRAAHHLQRLYKCIPRFLPKWKTSEGNAGRAK